MHIPQKAVGYLSENIAGLEVTPRFRMGESFGRPPHLARHGAASHPRGIAYVAPAAARAVAMALERPGTVVCGISALALFGLEYFADNCDTTLFGTVRVTEHASATSPTVLRAPNRPVWTILYRGERIPISMPVDALVDALKHVRAGMHSWPIFPVDGFDEDLLRAVQLVDAARRHLLIQPEELKEAARRRLDRTWLEKVLRLSSSGADSPKETEMRLICAQVCKKYGLSLTEQVPLGDPRRPTSTFDLAIRELMIGLMYDGQQHWELAQREKDVRINLESVLLGWVVVRVGAGMLGLLADYLEALIVKGMREKVPDADMRVPL